MPKIMVKDLKLNDTVDSVFIIKQKQLGNAKNGSAYASLKLLDKTGEVEGRLWDNVEALEQSPEGSFLRVYGTVTEYNSRIQLTVKKVKPAEPSEYQLSDFVRQTKKNIEEMFANLLAVIETFTDQDLKNLLLAFFNDADFAAKYKKAPAAVAMHSACIGGLLEHVDGLLQLALFVAEQYPALKRDLLLTGIILHDMGKVEELEYATSFRYSDIGKLVGHITIGVQMLDKKIESIPGFPVEKKMLLEHMLLAHHGEAEFGSPRQPMTIEAVALHQLDNLEAKLTGFTEFAELNRQNGTPWLPRAFMFDNRELYLGK